MLVGLQMSQWPQYNIVASIDGQRADRYWESNQQLGLGARVWTAQQLYRNRRPNDHSDMALKLSLACANKGVDYRLDLQHLTTDTSLASHALLQYSKVQRVHCIHAFLTFKLSAAGHISESWKHQP